ncbi:MAG: YbdD/YjiX family protein [Pseudomonadota bacterium]
MLKKMFSNFTKIARRLTGEDAYERYLSHHAEHHTQHPALSRKEFFKQEQERKWNGVRRCC